MADIPETSSTDPVELLGVGRRHLAVRDYPSAVSCLGNACEVLAQKYGQQADECGEAYLWYGKSLLGLAREESGVLGDGIPQGGEGNQEDEEGEEGGDENEDDEMNGDNEASEAKKSDNSESNVEEAKDKMETDDKVESSDQKTDSKDETCSTSTDVPGPAISDPEPSGSGEPSTNGDEGVEEDEDEVENLQVAWEVLELARDIFLKRGDKGKKELADVFLHLGEVSLESETYDKAIIDMNKSLELFKELYSEDDRRIAETHYQIGLAHSLSNGFDDAVRHFKSAVEILEARIKSLESPTVTADDANVKKYLANDPFYSVAGEIKELKELLPEIQEKIQDMIDYKAEAIKSVKESLGISTNGNSSSSKANGSTSKADEDKKASDISHLIKRKRKPSEEATPDEASASKKLAQ